MTVRPFGYHTKQFLEFVIVMTMVILKAKNVEILPLVWQFGLDQASVLHVGLPPRIFMLKKYYQMLMVCSFELSYITKSYLFKSKYFLPELSWSARPLGPCHQQSLY